MQDMICSAAVYSNAPAKTKLKPGLRLKQDSFLLHAELLSSVNPSRADAEPADWQMTNTQ